MSLGASMTSGARLLLTFFFSLFHYELVVGGIDNFRAVTLGQEVTVMVFWSRTGHPNPGHRRAGLAWAASLQTSTQVTNFSATQTSATVGLLLTGEFHSDRRKSKQPSASGSLR